MRNQMQQEVNQVISDNMFFSTSITYCLGRSGLELLSEFVIIVVCQDVRVVLVFSVFKINVMIMIPFMFSYV